MRFVKESVIRATAAEAVAFHERDAGVALVLPPWQKSEILQPPTSLAVGTQVRLRTRIGPFWVTVEAEHIAYEPGRMFADRMVKGPFRQWVHRHIVTPRGEHESSLVDDVEYELP